MLAELKNYFFCLSSVTCSSILKNQVIGVDLTYTTWENGLSVDLRENVDDLNPRIKYFMMIC